MRAVLVISHHGAIKRCELTADGPLTVGREPGCDVILVDRLISRRHAAFHVGPRGVEVEDLGSHNGTRLLSPESSAGVETASMVTGTPLAPGARVAFDPRAVVQIGSALVALEPATGSSEPSIIDVDGVVVDPAMRQLYELAERVATSPLPVLICGETGVGKELVAQFVHRRSARARRPLLAINCAAVAGELIEAELFGHEKGAFTGADRSTAGLLESADRGTFFFDEVGELTPAMQAKLLRVLEVGQLLRVGGRAPIVVDVRYIAATHRDLGAEVAAGRFREDLYYRLNGITLTIPPLRERPSEIVPLATAFAARALGRAPEFTAASISRLTEYKWPGNVRELRNVVSRAVVLSDGALIDAVHIQLTDRALGAPDSPEELRARAEALERQRILDALDACGGNQTRTAARLGLTRKALVVRLNKYDLPRPRKGR